MHDPEPAPSHILVVDDTATNLTFATCMLQLITPHGKVSGVCSGLEALERLGATAFTLVFMDIEMPGMGGIAATQAIRKFNKKVPVIALTGDDSSELRVRCKEAGMNGFVAKPFRQQELAAVVAAWNGVDVGVQEDSHILLVDHTETNLLLASYLLQRIVPSGKVSCANSGAQALDMVGATSFTMVLIATDMPGMNGLAATEAIRKFNKKVAVIALSGDDSSELKARCMAAGMNAVILKPFRQQDLAAMVTSWNGVDVAQPC
jgi:CheY-like chemotaxis protein